MRSRGISASKILVRMEESALTLGRAMFAPATKALVGPIVNISAMPATARLAEMEEHASEWELLDSGASVSQDSRASFVRRTTGTSASTPLVRTMECALTNRATMTVIASFSTVERIAKFSTSHLTEE